MDSVVACRTDTRFVEKRPNRYQLYQRLSARNLHATNLAAISCLYLSSGLRTNLRDSESSVNSPHMVAKMQEWPLEFLPKKGSHKKKRWHLRATNDDDASIQTVANEQVSQHSDLVSSFLLNDVSSQSGLTDTSNNHIKQVLVTITKDSPFRNVEHSYFWHQFFKIEFSVRLIAFP